jgi:N-acetyl sugar amidotransferase
MEDRICTRCVMDTSDRFIEFDEKGLCSHCIRYDELKKEKVRNSKEGEKELRKIVERIKGDGKGKKYDCVTGVSGGVDSTYLVHIAKKYGLRQLAVHMDNGWNSKLANKNISKILRKLDVDLSTCVVDWEEFKDLQLSYLRASVIDIEVPTDHALKGALFKIANENNVKHILIGTNFITEGVMPRSWGYNKNDYVNIEDIHKKFGKIDLKTFPMLTLWKRFYYQIIKKIRMVQPLNFIPYDKGDVKDFLSREYSWESYKGKHGESVFTYFYQSYILPRKFNVDKRKPHLSSLVCANQITREQALEELKKPIYPEVELKKDKEFVSRKFGLSEKEFDEIMNLPIKSHYVYRSYDKFLKLLRKTYKNFTGEVV